MSKENCVVLVVDKKDIHQDKMNVLYTQDEQRFHSMEDAFELKAAFEKTHGNWAEYHVCQIVEKSELAEKQSTTCTRIFNAPILNDEDEHVKTIIDARFGKTISALEVSIIKALLPSHVLRVIFEKDNGEMRSMDCTLNMNALPVGKHPKGTGRDANFNVLPVFDVEINDWRSFRLDRIKSVAVVRAY